MELTLRHPSRTPRFSTKLESDRNLDVSHDLTALAKARLELERLVQERTAELKAANKNLHQLSASLIRSQDEVRWRVARERHRAGPVRV